jgi:cytochrome b involved in lipid metabolism
MAELRIITKEELASHKDARSIWISIHDKIYDVTKFLEEHPGGEEVLLESGGQDGSEGFEDVGHSTDARELMAGYLIGELPEHERSSTSSTKKTTPSSPESSSDSGGLMGWIVPLGLAVAAALIYRYVIATQHNNS